MTWPFQSIFRQAARPAGRCPACGTLTLRAEPEGRDAPRRGADPPWLCTRCGSRYRRRYGQPWEKVSDGSGVTWLDVVGAHSEPPAAATPQRARFKIRDVMILIALFAFDLTLVGQLPAPVGPAPTPRWIVVPFLLAGQLWLVRYFRRSVDRLAAAPRPTTPSPRGRGSGSRRA